MHRLTLVILFQATDADAEDNAKILFGMGAPEEAKPRNPPFNILPHDGNLYNTLEFNVKSPQKFQFDIYAEDQPIDEPSKKTQTEVIVSKSASLLIRRTPVKRAVQR
jgi:hypothetical protein